MLSHNFVTNILYCVWVVCARVAAYRYSLPVEHALLRGLHLVPFPRKWKSSSLKNPEFRLTARAASRMTDISYAMDLRSSH